MIQIKNFDIAFANRDVLLLLLYFVSLYANLSTMKLSRLYPIILLISFLPVVIAQAQNQKPGFFWRISGNGLQKPSYLLGSVHLRDKRVFNFGDSIYAALEGSEGYAMELNPDSLMFYYFNNVNKDDVSP